MDVTSVFSVRSDNDLEPDLNTGDLDLSSMDNQDTSEFSVDNKVTADYLDEQQHLETENSVQALLDQEKGTSHMTLSVCC